MLPILESKRIVLRPPKNSDLVSFYYYASKPNIGPLAGWYPHRNLDDSKLILDLFIKEENIWAITLKNDDVMIGTIGLHNRQVNHVDGEGCEIGYILDDTYWNQGLMSEAVSEVLKYVFFTLDFDYVLASHLEGNMGSKRVLEKMKFKFINARKDKYLDNHEKTFYYYKITKREYLGYETTTISEV
ncbi:GNAT family N-acetyltransferase [Acholeplasma hippikon]|uniref:GNAT family N-acetyltransferase n=1 Tax=Acholeplasma hippikon TaxID=264636 RepID=UPI00138E3870|nr:GNAT family N-acetyltransferase [Acholeplasma hippikon]